MLVDQGSSRQRAMTHMHVGRAFKEISPEKTINGRQTTAEVWAPDYMFHVRSQTAIMDSQTFRVRLYECVTERKSTRTITLLPHLKVYFRYIVS